MALGEKSQPIYKQAAVSYCLRLFCFCRNGIHTVLIDFKLKGINTAGLAGLHILPAVRQQIIIGSILAQSVRTATKTLNLGNKKSPVRLGTPSPRS